MLHRTGDAVSGPHWGSGPRGCFSLQISPPSQLADCYITQRGMNRGRDGEREVLPAAIELLLINDKMTNLYNARGLNTQVIIGVCFYKVPNICAFPNF